MTFAIPFLDKIHVDDPVGALPVHLVNGVFGTLAVGLFHTTKGLFYGGGFRLLGVQALGVLSVAVWVVGTATLLFWFIKHTVGLRVSPKEELEGLDIGEHGTEAYPEFETKHGTLDGFAPKVPATAELRSEESEAKLAKGV